MDPLLVRAAAAHELVNAGLLDGELALAYVIFPPPGVEAASREVARADRRAYPPELRTRALELVDAGMSQSAVGKELGVPRPTINSWVQARHSGAALPGGRRVGKPDQKLTTAPGLPPTLATENPA